LVQSILLLGTKFGNVYNSYLVLNLIQFFGKEGRVVSLGGWGSFLDELVNVP